MTPNHSDPPDPSRRKALKAMAVVAIGGCVALLGSGLLSPPRIDTASQSQATTASQSSMQDGGSSQTVDTRVKVRYFQMNSALPGVTEEYYALPSPAVYSELRAAVIASHPVLARMMPTMLVLVEGVVAKGDTPLHNGDEVDYIPTIGGG